MLAAARLSEAYHPAADAPMKGEVEILEAAFVAVALAQPPLATRKTDLGIDIEDHGQIGPEIGAALAVKLLDQRRRNPPARPLVAERREDEAVGDDMRSRFERRQDHGFDMLRAVGDHQQRLGHRRPRIGARRKQEFAQLLSGWRAARLAGEQDLFASIREMLRQMLDLRRRARALAAAKCDELAARHRRPRPSACSRIPYS